MELMQVTDYNSLKIHQKARILGSVSVFLGSFIAEDINTSLYHYNNFYVEVIWDSHTSSLIEILAFKYGDRLNKYLDRISLSELVA